jgi:hypothetical protein
VQGWREPFVQKRRVGQFVGRVEKAYRLSEVGRWVGRPKPYKREECREYFAPDLRRAADYPSKQIPEPVAGHFGLPLFTADHFVQQGGEDLDYAEYEEGTSPNVFLKAFEKVRRTNAVADDL